ncbi:hypothetical protein RRG08_031081 [Elysia crispata]|uniref:Peptidase M16 C-terminal domain-containing protein n=1 Tax=Elysia crispata TaxID=231223 RepID=A0AAE0ZF79_9GAST|nr:hypothetical protein RRG08_031081 [Elysia crispata]
METGAEHLQVTRDDENNLYSALVALISWSTTYCVDQQRFLYKILSSRCLITPESLIMPEDQNEQLLPSHTYSVLSRGNPAHTTSLTHQQLQEAHAKHYHPSNAMFFTYGPLPLESHMELIDISLVEFS